MEVEQNERVLNENGNEAKPYRLIAQLVLVKGRKADFLVLLKNEERSFLFSRKMRFHRTQQLGWPAGSFAVLGIRYRGAF